MEMMELMRRAWDDAASRHRWCAAAQATLPATPAGALVLTDEDLGAIVGGATPSQDPGGGTKG